MAENENVTEEVTQTPEETGKLKIKKPKLKKFNEETGNIKVDLRKPKDQENEVKEDNVVDEGVVAKPDNAESTEKQEEVQPKVETQEQDTSVVEEVVEEVKQEVEEKEIVEEIIQAKETGKALPENLQKVVDFMEDTGGNIEDYVRLNQDFSNLDE